MVNILLVVGAVKRIPSITFTWLCANAIFMLMSMVRTVDGQFGIFKIVFCQVGIVGTLLFGTTKLSLNYNEYVTSLTIMGMVTGINLFCWIVVFTFRKNLLMEVHLQRSPSCTDELSSVNNRCSSTLKANAPPPSYYEIEGYRECKLPPEDSPPEYEAAAAMLSSEQDHLAGKGPMLRKKSLTNNEV